MAAVTFVGKISRMHQVPHSPYLADQLSNAYDCYLAIIRETDKKISIELGREDPKWAIKNVCAPCLYKTEDEPKMKFEFLAAMDGNNSLKLVDSTYRAGTVRTDSRMTESPRWIKPEDVDLFKDEVGKVKSFLPNPDTTFHDILPQSNRGTRQGAPAPIENTEDLSTEETAWLNLTEHDDLAKCLDTCVDRWRNAGPEARKKMFALFAVAGIFVAVCRHGHVLVICDMIRSGEL
jgi:hypothetical protein